MRFIQQIEIKRTLTQERVKPCTAQHSTATNIEHARRIEGRIAYYLYTYVVCTHAHECVTGASVYPCIHACVMLVVCTTLLYTPAYVFVPKAVHWLVHSIMKTDSYRWHSIVSHIWAACGGRTNKRTEWMSKWASEWVNTIQSFIMLQTAPKHIRCCSIRYMYMTIHT